MVTLTHVKQHGAHYEIKARCPICKYLNVIWTDFHANDCCEHCYGAYHPYRFMVFQNRVKKKSIIALELEQMLDTPDNTTSNEWRLAYAPFFTSNTPGSIDVTSP